MGVQNIIPLLVASAHKQNIAKKVRQNKRNDKLVKAQILAAKTPFMHCQRVNLILWFRSSKAVSRKFGHFEPNQLDWTVRKFFKAHSQYANSSGHAKDAKRTA